MKDGLMFGNEKINIDDINNPVDDRKIDKILKKEGETLSMEDLRSMLATIKWGLVPIGCDHYAPVNQKGERTNFEIRASSRGHWEGEKKDQYVKEYDELEMRLFRDNEAFGTQEHSGFMTLDLSKCEIRLNEGTIFISTGGFCLFLSNHDKKWTRTEAMLHRLPRDVQILLKCEDCKHVVNKSKMMSSLEMILDWTRIVMSGPLCTKRCGKCGSSTYSDMNAHYLMKIYKNGKLMKFEQIKKDSEQYMKEYNELRDLDRAEAK